MQDVDWDGLRVFQAVARAGSFAGAGQALGMHETTIARAVRRLERQMGQILWRGPEAGVTPEGAVLCAHVNVMADHAVMAQAAVSGRAAPRGAVRLTAVPWVIEAAVVPSWQRVRPRLPDVTLSLIGAHDSLNLLHGEADIALRLARPEVQGDVVVRKLGYVRFVVAGEGDWIGYVPEMAHLPQARWTSEMEGPIGLRVSDQGAVTTAIAAGLGRGWLPTCLATDPDPGFAARARPLWCLTHPRTRHAPAVRAVCDDVLALVAATLCD